MIFSKCITLKFRLDQRFLNKRITPEVHHNSQFLNKEVRGFKIDWFVMDEAQGHI